MRAALFEPFSGIAGDMTIAAFLDAGLPWDVLEAGLAKLPLEGYEVRREAVSRAGFAATRFVVSTGEEHPHRTLVDVQKIIDGANFPARVTARAHAVFERLAETEAVAHGSTPDEVHFHEVGAVDAIVDVVGAALALEHFDVEEVLVTRIRLGTGETVCRHGRIPVPAPATMRLLAGFPVSFAEGDGETVTPTGASILAATARPVGPDETFVPEATGFGAGTRDDTSMPNLLRITVGRLGSSGGRERVLELRANVDDQTPEALAHAAAKLLEAGALDAWVTPVLMKKGRPGHVLNALVREADVAVIEDVFFRETTTFGVRRSVASRTILEREHVTVALPWGEVRVKVGRRAGEVVTAAPEYEDCARLAERAGVSLREVHAAALAAFSPA
ncbi:MAG: nickel pincer cofactor biosynthesis protein LarC [Planctomycetota bacterium]